MRKLFVLLLLASVASCGVKNDLVKPNGQATPKDQHDPSQPTNPVGR